MSKFRLTMARQLGEQTAKKYGFNKFPIDPVKITEKEKIQIEAKPPDKIGVSGGIIFHDCDVIIFYATNIDNIGFQRFTIGHELGHYFLPGHPEAITNVAPIHVSRAGFSQGSDPIEIEADHFSAGLLMPRDLVSKLLANQTIGLDGIIRLSEDAECSVTASAIRAAECCEYPLAVIVSREDRICYGFLSEAFKGLRPSTFPRKGNLLPKTTTKLFNADEHKVLRGDRACGQAMLSDWFEGSSGLFLDEEVIGLGSYGYSLTVLSSEELPEQPLEEEDEEEALVKSWTPKFAYGR